VAGDVLDRWVIREHAVLPVIPGREAEFEGALREALPHISASAGFLGLTVSRGIETPSHYLLLVEWEDIEAHTEGFRGSPAYDEWRALLHHFYDPFPDVQHFSDVAQVVGR
jgi:heme-degrading monooxygenase HmoA